MIKTILKSFEQFDGSRSKHILFQDWCKLMAISISNQVWHSEKREAEYIQLANQYKQEELQRFGGMLGMLTVAFERELRDYLGQIYMEGDMGNKQTGQFFTPFHLAYLTAELGVLPGTEPVLLNEPASGGGAMVLATAKSMQDRGENYQQRLRVIAQDLDWNGVYMTYVQLSLAGISAKVIQGDTLKNEPPTPGHVLYTPMYVMQGGFSRRRHLEGKDDKRIPAANP